MEAIVFVVPLPISAMSNSIPFGRLMRTRCSAPVAGLRIGRAVDSSTPGIHDARCSALDIHVKLDALEERGMHGARHRAIDPPVGRSFVSLATIQYDSKSVSLLAVRTLINDGLALTVALVDWSRLGVEQRCAEAIERHISKVTLIDPNGRESPTVSVRGAA